MTREQAINYLKSSGMTEEQIETVINALTCEDCISRQAVLEKAIIVPIAKVVTEDKVICRKVVFVEDIQDLPSVTPKFTDAEIQKMQELEQAQLEKAYELGRAEIQPCEDCISRTEVIKIVNDMLMGEANHKIKALEQIQDLPSVTPKGVTITDFADRCRECGRIRSCEDAISRKDVMAIIEWAYDECKIDGYTDYCEMRDMVKGLPSVTPQESEDYISRAALLARIDEERKHLLALKMDGAEHILVHHARRIIEDMPTVTPKAELWNKLYLWLNDMHLGISPDEFTPDDERKCRTAQTDIIEDVMGWIEANVFEQKTGSED